MKQEAAPLKKYLKPHYYLKNYLTVCELKIFQPFIKMAINQNFADCSDEWLLKLNASKCKICIFW